ncbi:MAG: hypothetical protein ACRC2R_05310, partial [Xenococcaceae cyanobacterium]
TTVLFFSAIAIVAVLLFRSDLIFPRNAPKLSQTYTPQTRSAPKGIGDYDVLGKVIDADRAAELLATDAGKQQLSPENGAIKITQELLDLGRKAFYTETFGNEYFITNVTGAIDGALNPFSISKAVLALGGKPTNNLKVSVDRDIEVGGKVFKAGTILNTGLDVAKGSLLPLGMQTHLNKGKLQVGITCALCHAAVDARSGLILEGAPNTDLDAGLILAMASNSAAWFRQSGVNPLTMPSGDNSFFNSEGTEVKLVDVKAMEDAVDAEMLSWPPGSFDSASDIINNPTQTPSSYTHDTYPYGWNGFASVGWFHGLTTLNNNVHAVNSDATTGADASLPVWGIDKDTYLATILQNSADRNFRLPASGVNPLTFFKQIDPTPGMPGINKVERMPGYPKGSVFMLDGLIAGSIGMPFGEQLNAMSAWQNTLAPPPNKELVDSVTLQQGQKIFDRAGCITCHSGRYFTNHDVIPLSEIGTQPSRTKSLFAFKNIFEAPRTFSNSVTLPVPPNSPVLEIPTKITPEHVIKLAYGIDNSEGGYKVASAIGLHVTAPYLHDGGVAASADALKQKEDGFYRVAKPEEMGMAGTLMHQILPDPASSLRVLIDRDLRKEAISSNRQDPRLQKSHVEGIGHEYWIDKQAGFSAEEQNSAIEFLLSLDDEPDLISNQIVNSNIR